MVLRSAEINCDTVLMDAAWFSLPAFSTDYKFFYKSPQFHVSQTFFLDAFTFEFWMASMALNLLIIGAGWIFYRFFNKSDLISALFIGVFVFSGQGLCHKIFYNLLFLFILKNLKSFPHF